MLQSYNYIPIYSKEEINLMSRRSLITILGLLFWFMVCSCGPASADVLPTQIEYGVSHENLSGDYGDWWEYYLSASHKFGSRKTLYGLFRETQRFDLTDQEFMLGGYFPMDKQWTGNIEGTVSPTHRVLEKWSARGTFHVALGGGNGIEVGVRHREFNTTTVNSESIGVERYWGKFRAMYKFSISQSSTAGSTSSHSATINYYYGERDSIGIILASGREAESLGAGRVLNLNVRSATLYGAHWLSPDLAVTWRAGVTDQDPVYSRAGFSLGLRHAF